MSVLVLPERSPIPLRQLALALETDLGRHVQVRDGYLQANVSETELFDAADVYLTGVSYYVTRTYDA